MNTKPQLRPAEAANAVDLDLDYRGLLRRDTASPNIADAAEPPHADLAGQVRDVAVVSADEIDLLIAEMQAFRDELRADGDRLQREVSAFTRRAETAVGAVRIFSENASHWRDAGADESPRLVP